MLVLSRKRREVVVVKAGDGLERLLKITVLEIGGGRVKLGFDADREFLVHRLEIWEQLATSNSLETAVPIDPQAIPR